MSGSESGVLKAQVGSQDDQGNHNEGNNQPYAPRLQRPWFFHAAPLYISDSSTDNSTQSCMPA